MLGTPVTVESASLLDDEDVEQPTYQAESSCLPESDSMRRCGAAVFSWGVRVQFTIYAVAYFTIGTLVYYAAESNLADSSDGNWTFWQAFFYAVSVGLSEGFTNVTATTNFTEFWTGFYMVLGQSLIVGGILLGIDVLVEEVENSYRITVPFFKRKDVIASIMYILCWIFGMVWCATYQEMDGARSFLWTMSTLTGAGMVNPVDGDFNLVVTALFCLIGRPVHIYITLLLSRKLLPGHITLTLICTWMLGAILWFVAGCLFYHLYDSRFSVLQAVFYAAESGFLVGYKLDIFKPKHYIEILFTSVYLFFGSTFINTGLVLLTQFIFTGIGDAVTGLSIKDDESTVAEAPGGRIPRGNVLQRAMEEEEQGAGGQARGGGSGDDDDDEQPWCRCKWWCTGWRLPFIAFFCLVFLGAQYASVVFEYTAARSFLYSVSTITTTGVTNPPTDDNALIFSTVFLIMGIPVTSVSLGLIAQLLIQKLDPAMVKHLGSLSAREEARL